MPIWTLRTIEAYLSASAESRDEFDYLLWLLDGAMPASVSVVGNAQSLLQSQHGSLIDRRSVIRFNRATIIDSEAQGSRTDFIASSELATFQMYREVAGPPMQFIFTPYRNKHIGHLKEAPAAARILRLPLRLSKQLIWLIASPPSTGCQILYLLKCLSRTDVALFGFDWKASPTFYNKSASRYPHNFDYEKTLIRQWAAELSWQIYS